MTSPDDFSTRLSVAGSAVGTSRPALASSLARSSLSTSQIGAVGGFASALALSTANRLAADSGAKPSFSADERNSLEAIGETVDQPEQDEDSRSFLEKAVDGIAGAMSNTGNALIHNPVTGAVLDVFSLIGDAAHYPFRLFSDAVDTSNDTEIDRQMTARGYDPNSDGDYFRFMFSQGESQYHDLSDVRENYGDDLVDDITKALADPEQFQADFEKMDPTAAAQLQAKMESKEWAEAAAAIDRKHISPGRDLANLLLPAAAEDTAAFTLMSGSLDAAYTWFTDPTLILGKASKATRALDALGRDASGPMAALAARVPALANRRAGLQGVRDQAGIEALLRTDESGKAVTQVGKGWESFLDRAKQLREQDKLAKAAESPEERLAAQQARAGIYAGMQAAYGPLMPLLDEVNGLRAVGEAANAGGRVDRFVESATGGGNAIVKTDPIETLDDLAKHLVSSNGLLRLAGGENARSALIMPGRLSLTAERRFVRASKFDRGAKSAEKWINYARGDELLPHESEIEALGRGDYNAAAGDAQATLLQQHNGRALRARAEQIGRRFRTQIPDVKSIDLTSGDSSKLVDLVAKTYLNRGDAARLTSAYALADVATRRNILRGVLQQSFHASGLMRSEAGRTFAERYLSDAADLGKQQYGMDKTSEVLINGQKVQAALYQDQLSNKVVIPSFREMNYLATKFAVGGWTDRMGMANVKALSQSGGMDALMGTIKLGWITSAAGGLRNAIDEVANFAAYGMSGEALRGRYLFSDATKKIRADRRKASREYLDLVKTVGRDEADKQVGLRGGEAVKSYEDAKLAHERALRGQAARDGLADTIAGRVAAAEARHQAAKDASDNLLEQYKAQVGVPGIDLARRDALHTDWVNSKDAIAKTEQALFKARKEHRAFLEDPKPWQDKLEDQLAKRDTLDVDEAAAQLKDAEEHLQQTRLLETAIRHRVPLAFRSLADNIHDLLITPALGHLLSVWPGIEITDDMVKYASELTDRELTRTLRDGVFQAHYADTALLHNTDDEAMQLHRAGLKARPYQFRPAGWGEIEPDGGQGLDAWAKMLHLRFANSDSVAHDWVDTIRRMVAPERKVDVLDETGKVTKTKLEGGVLDKTALDSAKAAVRARLDDESLRHFIESAEVFKYTRAGLKVGDDPALLAQVKDEYADRVSADLMLALGRGRDGAIRVDDKLLDALVDARHTGQVPDRSFLAGIKAENRPEKVIGQRWAPFNEAHQPGTFPRGYTQMMSHAYDKVVTDQINALSRNPLVTALYVNARRNTADYERYLIDEAGFDEKAATEVAKRVALRHAEAEAFRHIDNPYVSSQFSLVSRNMWAFVRAQEDWLRRWGRTIKDNPELIRKAQLLIHGGESAGLVEADDQGELTFVYPGSGLMLGVFGKLFGAHGEDNPAKLPITGELTSQLTFLNPSLDNPIGFSGTPLISLPLKALTKFLGPDHAVLSASLDKAVNGDLGAGRDWYEQLLPGWANRILGGVLSDDPGSKFGAAYTNALANLESAGALDDPAVQTATGKANLQHALAVQTRNALAANVLFGFFAPAAPQVQLGADGTTGDQFQGTAPDWAAHKEGIRSLKDEARRVFSRLPYEQALAWWAAVHPNELIYAQSGASARTQVGTKGASAPATLKAATYLEQNQELFNRYGGKGGVAAYFLPQGTAGTTDGEYSDIAYRAELEMGIREYKTLDEYFDDVVTARGAAQYYAAKDAHDQAKARAVQSGANTDQLDAQWDAQKAEIMAGNPLLSARFAQSAVNNAGKDGQLAQLVALVQDEDPAITSALGRNREGVTALLQAYQAYQEGAASLDGRRSRLATKQRQQLKDTYTASVQAITDQYSDLADLGRAVFRLPD